MTNFTRAKLREGNGAPGADLTEPGADPQVIEKLLTFPVTTL